MMTNQALEEAVEGLMDTDGAQRLLVALATVCGEKAEHVRLNYGDRPLAQQWATLEGLINRAVRHAEGL